jgi:hypothetical protein
MAHDVSVLAVVLDVAEVVEAVVEMVEEAVVVEAVAEDVVWVAVSEVVEVAVVVSVLVVFSAQTPQEKSHRCAPLHVGQYTVSHSWSVWLQISRQSGYLQQVVDDSVVVLLSEVVVDDVVVCVNVIPVWVLRLVVVVDVSVVVVLLLTVVELLVPVIVVVVVVVTVVSEVENEPVVAVSVRVVQKPHFRSHMPAKLPQSGQKRMLQASLQKVVFTFWHVASQSASDQMLTDTHAVAELTVVLLVAEPVETVVVVVTVVLLDVSDEVVREVVVPEVVLVVSVVLSVLVMLCMQKRSPLSGSALRQEVSHMCAAEQVGQKAMRHRCVRSGHPGMQSR